MVRGNTIAASRRLRSNELLTLIGWKHVHVHKFFPQTSSHKFVIIRVSLANSCNVFQELQLSVRWCVLFFSVGVLDLWWSYWSYPRQNEIWAQNRSISHDVESELVVYTLAGNWYLPSLLYLMQITHWWKLLKLVCD